MAHGRLISWLRADVNIQLTVPAAVPVDNIVNFAVSEQPHGYLGPAVLPAALHFLLDDRPSDLLISPEVETVQFRLLSDPTFHAQEKGHWFLTTVTGS